MCSPMRVITWLCLTLCELMDCSPPRSSVHGIFQARILDNIYPCHLYQRKTQSLQDKGNISDLGVFFGGGLLNSEHKVCH